MQWVWCSVEDANMEDVLMLETLPSSFGCEGDSCWESPRRKHSVGTFIIVDTGKRKKDGKGRSGVCGMSLSLGRPKGYDETQHEEAAIRNTKLRRASDTYISSNLLEVNS